MIANWTEAMNWWRTNPLSAVIRQTAVDKLVNETCDGQGISSSDINHTVYGMYQDWVLYCDYCKQNNTEPLIIDFLMNN